MTMIRRDVLAAAMICGLLTSAIAVFAVESIAQEPIDIGMRRELFVDRFLIDKLDGVSLQLQAPKSGGVALKFDQPW